MPEYVSKGGAWVRKEQVIVKPEPKEPVVVKEPEKVETKEEKPVTKSKPKKGRPKGR